MRGNTECVILCRVFLGMVGSTGALYLLGGGGGGQGHFKFYLNVILNKFKHSQFLQS